MTKILIDAAHESDMEFVASVRLPSYLGLTPGVRYESPLDGGAGMNVSPHAIGPIKLRHVFADNENACFKHMMGLS